jgi:hypothetical protein
MKRMIYSYRDLLKQYGNERQVAQAVTQGKIKRISRGYYSDFSADTIDYVQRRYPRCILTGRSAFYYYGLTDQIPEKIEVASLFGSTRIHEEKVSQSFQIIGIFGLGKVCDNQIVIYDKERLLIELFRLKKRYSFDYFKEVLTSYRSIAESLDFYKVASYLTKMSYGKRLYQEIREAF